MSNEALSATASDLSSQARPPGSRPAYLTAGWILLLLLALFPVIAACLDLLNGVRAGMPSDHLAAFAQLAGIDWNRFQPTTPGVARYISLLEAGYAVHELVFGLFFLVIVAIPFRRGERWAWLVCWVVLGADIFYSASFGSHDATLLRQSLIADIAPPVLLLAQLGRFFPLGRLSAKR